MKDTLPPTMLVQTWLELSSNRDIPVDVKSQRIKQLEYYFGSIELASFYVERSQYKQDKAS